jgi:hypothetical protein
VCALSFSARGNGRVKMNKRRILFSLLVIGVVLFVYWLLPIRGQVIITTDSAAPALVFPQIHFEPSNPAAGAGVSVMLTDNVPWANVRLMLGGQSSHAQDWHANPGGTWTWRANFTMPDGGGTLIFYHDCDTGCIERARFTLGEFHTTIAAPRVPTKLGVVFANMQREWHGRAAWDVELTYAQESEEEYWDVDALTARVQAATARGLRVLVRVDYAKGQTLPPRDDNLALSAYLQYVRRLARDARLQPVSGYIIGSGFNDRGSNSLTPERAVTPEWYARVFNGYGLDPTRTDNVIQTVHGENPFARVLVGPVRPFNRDQNGARTHRRDAPWLNYMNTLVALLDEGAQAKAAVNIPFSAPDGFAVNAPGRPDAPELAGRAASEEPRLDLPRAEWNGAQVGFRVYRDWLDIINRYLTTRGLPVYINSANTFAPDEGIAPTQNYARGWLTSAFDVINGEPQVQALCWFLDDDFSKDTRWDGFSLTKQIGRMKDAAEEFDALLQQ